MAWKKFRIWAASLVAVLLQGASLSCLWCTLATTSHISFVQRTSVQPCYLSLSLAFLLHFFCRCKSFYPLFLIISFSCLRSQLMAYKFENFEIFFFLTRDRKRYCLVWWDLMCKLEGWMIGFGENLLEE